MLGSSSLEGRLPALRPPPCSGAHLIRWILHLLHIPSNHIFRVLTCKDRIGLGLTVP